MSRLERAKRPAGVYIIAIYFTAVCLYSLGSLLYVLFFELTPEMRHQLCERRSLALASAGDLPT